MSKLSPFLEGVLSAFILLPSAVSAKPNYIEPTDSNLQTIDALSTHQPFIEVGLIMEQVASEKRFLEQSK
ncbi:hypothetical protein [Moraxella bovis]|uniref:hypothetical protein n=1 Tax=Moraxella bovis TaxID=476 RepID=UPI000DC7905B|nr:hypothetical protein [Moraxella bovis]AWY19951.1 hypothetical protein DQF64_05215 [Moraxella bovis]UYZ94449.1 hypothetical protein LP121_11295 [Moraxella bovis]